MHIGGAVRNGGLYNLGSAVTLSGAVAMAGGPALRGHGNMAWVFRDGEIITTIQGGTSLIADSPIRSGDRLFVAWESAVPERSWIYQNPRAFGAMLIGAVGLTLAFVL